MYAPQHQEPERKTAALETITVNLLRLGTSLSAALMGLGLILLLAQPARGRVPGASGAGAGAVAAQGAPAGVVGAAGAAPQSLGELLQGLLHLQPVALIQLGVLVLILTPVFRLVAALLVYLREGDRAYTAISGLILSLLILGAVLGMME